MSMRCCGRAARWSGTSTGRKLTAPRPLIARGRMPIHNSRSRCRRRPERTASRRRAPSDGRNAGRLGPRVADAGFVTVWSSGRQLGRHHLLAALGEQPVEKGDGFLRPVSSATAAPSRAICARARCRGSVAPDRRPATGETRLEREPDEIDDLIRELAHRGLDRIAEIDRAGDLVGRRHEAEEALDRDRRHSRRRVSGCRRRKG